MALSWVMLLLLFFVSPAISKYDSPTEGMSESLRAWLQVALDHAVTARANTSALGPKCSGQREKAAWTDCVDLHDSIVNRLNQTLDLTTKSTAADVQTWLSTALTNRETCREGFLDLGVTNNVMPLIFKNDLGKLLSTCLAQNKGNYGGRERYKDGFPTWLSVGDCKLLQSAPAASQANIVVAQDGSGNYTTLGEAIAAASKRIGNDRFVIYVKAGTYAENVLITSSKITLVGDGIGKTIITGSKSVGDTSTTFKTATAAVAGDGFTASGITFRNTAGPQNHQAVAFRSGSDHSAFYQCSFEGYQDTLYVHSNRQFYRECDIYGTVDAIFGNAAAVFQNCNIFARNPPNKRNTLTAQGRIDINQTTGISIHNCNVTVAPDLAPVQSTVKTYLGRPWKEYSTTVFMKTFLDSLIDPAGWMPWNGNFALSSLYYGEYMNSGAGSSTTNRVKWPGYHVITSADEASNFTVGKFFDGDSWLPDTNIPYNSGL